MSQERGEQEDMQPEYDIRGGIRGKYFERYQLLATITLEDSPLVAKNTASAPQIGSVTRRLAWPTPLPSPNLQIAEPARSVVHASTNPPR